MVSLIWVVFTLLFAVQMRFMDGLSWQLSFARAAADWMPWIVLSPAIFWLAMRFPFAPGKVVMPVILSILVCAGSIYVAEGSFQFIRPMLTGEARPRNWGGVFRPAAGENRAAGFANGGEEANMPRPSAGPREPRAGLPAWEVDPAAPPGPNARRLPPGEGPLAGRGPAAMENMAGVQGRGPMQHMMHFHLPISLFIVMASNAYAYFLQMRDRERKASQLARNLAEARLTALQMQLHPHFLFNALNATTALIRRDPDAAEEMIANLSDLLRLALSARDRHEVSVAEELGYLESYLAIERVRFGDRLKVHWQVDEATKEARVPVLLLQPIVENAIRHGIERRNVDVGELWVTITRHDGRLQLSVRDNGPGLQPANPSRRGHGVGLDNTRARLAALHGPEAEARIESGPEGGCRVTIEMPFQLQNQPDYENQGAHR